MSEISSQLTPSSRSARGWSWSREASDYRTWWESAGPARRFGPAAGVTLFWLLHVVLGGFRGDHVALGAAVLAVAYSGPRGAPWFRLLLPAALMGAVYDGQGYVRQALAGQLTIHVAEPANFDRALFGIQSGSTVLTPTQWLQAHTHPLIDLLCAFTYVSFIPVFLALAVSFRWSAESAPTGKRLQCIREAERMTWAFFWLGLISCATYYLYPAAPPWYADQYGFGPAIVDAPASAAGANRVDALLGWRLFANVYGRNPNIFGAVPSLHVAIPLLGCCFAWRLGKLRVATSLYTAVMAFSALYLNHHYIVDLLWGAAYVAVIMALIVAARGRDAALRTASGA